MKVETTNKHINTVADPITGEIIKQQIEIDQVITTTRKVNSYDEFIMVYLDDMSSFLRIDSATQCKLLALIWRDISFNNPVEQEGNIITIIKSKKDKWAKEIGVSVGSINNAITVLAKKELLIPTDRSTYQLNPKYFFKGTSKDRARVLKKEFNYEIESNTEFESTP